MPPQNFLITCSRCSWRERTTGIAADLQHLREVPKCNSCGGPRKFHCPKCGGLAKMFRVRPNS